VNKEELQAEYDKLLKDYKELNKMFVTDHALVAQFKERIETVLKSFCVLSSANLAIAIRVIINENPIGDEVIRSLRIKNSLADAYKALKGARELVCPKHDEDAPLKDCYCVEKEEAVADAQEALEKILELA
jgi:hypothetical protein